MYCMRCRQEFPTEKLSQLSRVARIVAFPYLFLMQSDRVSNESQGWYCRPCRRQLNVCLLFFGFLVGVMLLAGLIGLLLRQL